jgi:translation initiation factor IF-1
MVKNTKGGKGAKGLARKLTNSYESHKLRQATCNEEKYAIITKMLGNGMCYAATHDKLELICHIRNKFRGRSKRGNMVTKGSLVLIGIRDWEEPNYKNCDLLEIYDIHDLKELKKLPNVNISHLENELALFETDLKNDHGQFDMEFSADDDVVSNDVELSVENVVKYEDDNLMIDDI